MAKKPNLASVLDGLPAPVRSEPSKATVRKARGGTEADQGSTVLVGANLPPSYARNLAWLHAETGMTKKELLQEALDMLFVQKGGRVFAKE